MNILSRNHRLERAARLLEESADFRVLRKIPELFQRMEGNTPPDADCIALVDVETSGLSLAEDEVIELAVMLVWLSPEGEALAHLGPWSWLNDPGKPLTAEIARLTGLSDACLGGQAIDLEQVGRLLDRADLVAAHNAAFDIQWFDQLLPERADKPWACSMRDIDWQALEFEGRSQPFLLAQHGWFSAAHRAASDVWSLFWLLSQKRPDADGDEPRSHFARLRENAAEPSVLISAHRSPFGAKDALKARGFRWNPTERVWQKQVWFGETASELEWFRSKALPEPTMKTLSAVERYR